MIVACYSVNNFYAFNYTRATFEICNGRAREVFRMVNNMVAKERRSYVRGDLFFKVKYKILTSDQYEDLTRVDNAILSPSKRVDGVDITDNEAGTDFGADTFLINYLVQMDEKLDQILDLLAKDKSTAVSFHQGLGQNISGSGMQLVVDQPVETGQVIHSKLFLSKLPLVFIDIFGKIMRVKPMEENGRTVYRIGIKFLDLNITDRETIIASVFQMQRKAIREKKIENI